MIFNLYKRPIEKATLDAWSKMADDIAKVAMLGVPAMLYKGEALNITIPITILLLIAVYLCLTAARNFRIAATDRDKE